MVQDDPIRQKKNDRWRQLVDQGMEPNDAYDAVSKEYDVPRLSGEQPATRPAIQRPAAEATMAPTTVQPKAPPTQFIRSALQGASLGLADEAEAAVRSLSPNEAYDEAAQDVRGKIKAFRQERPGAAFATEMVGGVLTGGLAGGSKTLIGKALSSPLVSGMIAGGAGAEGGLAERAKGAALGGVAGKVIGTILTPTRTLQRDVVQDVAAAQSPAGSRIGRALSDLRNKAATGVEKSQRFAADVLEKRGFAGAARAIEPVDETTIRRAVTKNLPGSGLTEGALSEASEQAGLRAQQAAQKAKAVGDEVQAVQVETVNRSKALAERAIEQAKVRSQQLLDDAKQQATQVIGGVRQRMGTAGRVREQLRTTQLADAEQSYALVRRFGRPEREPIAVYDAILKSPGLRGAFEAATAGRAEAGITRRLAAAEGDKLFRPLGAERLPKVTIQRRDGTTEQVQALTLKTMDQMRQNVNERITAYLSGSKETGIAPQMGRKLLKQIGVLEDKFLSAYPDEARAAIQEARAAYREKFVALEALQDGLNLGGVKADKSAKLLSANPKAFNALAERMREQYVTPEAREAFRAGGREWFNNLVTDRLDDALTFAQQVTKTEGGRKRVALVFGKDMVNQMQQIAKLAEQAGTVAAKGKARAASIAEIGERSAEALGDRLRPGVFGAQDLSGVVRGQADEAAKTLAAARQARTALAPGGREAAASMVDVTLPALSNDARGAVQDYGASAVQREIAGLDAQTALARLQQLKDNPAARALFGSQLDRTIAELEKRTLGSVARPALARAAGVRLGSIFTGRDE